MTQFKREMLKNKDIVFRINRRIDRCFEIMSGLNTDFNKALDKLVIEDTSRITSLFGEYQVFRKTFYSINSEYNNNPRVDLVLLEDRLDLLEGRFVDVALTLKYLLGDL